MKMIALLVVCTVATLSQGVQPAHQSLPKHLVEAQWDSWTASLFIRERTITIEAGAFTVDPETEYIVWAPRDRNNNPIRHTSTNAVETKREFDVYTYFFDPSKDIEIYDRRPNTPIWYGIAAGATAIAMVVFYLIVRKKRTKELAKRI